MYSEESTSCPPLASWYAHSAPGHNKLLATATGGPPWQYVAVDHSSAEMGERPNLLWKSE